MSFAVSFSDWLSKYSQYQYKDSTVRRYLKALEMAPERLDLELDMPVLDYSSVDMFNEVYRKITQSDKYDFVNKNYGNNDLSAALHTFGKYVKLLSIIGGMEISSELYSPEWFEAMAQQEYLQKFEAEARELRLDFCSRFGIEQLMNLSGKELLVQLFYSDVDNRDNLCYTLEHHPRMREIFGSILGGSAFKFGLFYHRDMKCWITGSPTKHRALTEVEAITVAANIRDSLVKGAKIIVTHLNTQTIEDYIRLHEELTKIPGIDTLWVLKYYQMLFPEILPIFYGKDIQTDIIRFLKQDPGETPIVRMGQISLFFKRCHISSPVFGQIYYLTYLSVNGVGYGKKGVDGPTDILSDTADTVNYWLYSPGDNASKWEEFYREGIMAIGWDFIGDLSLFSSKDEMKQKMRELEDPSLSYKMTAHATWQFAKMMKPGDIIFVKKGMYQIVGRGVVLSDYKFDPTRSDSYKNIRLVNWTHKGEWPHPGKAAMKTLTEITSYTDYIEKLNALFANKDVEDAEEKVVEYQHYGSVDFLNDVFMGEDDYNNLVNIIRSKKNIILQGAPGVGKTYAAKRLAYSIMGVKDQERVMMIQFHQSYSYEDFIMGFRPSDSGFELRKGAFYNFCKKAEIDSDNEYFFIIDEINRGSLSKIFGELLMLIENDKRGIQLQLLYSDEKFAVPANVYIIGMMNTADRSLAMLDFALRRRFAFFDMKPGFRANGFLVYQSGLENVKLDRLIHCVENLNVFITEDESLGEGFCIGHSYFCNLKIDEITDKALYRIVEYELLPLLKEYWFDDSIKVKEWCGKLRSAIS